MSVGRSVCRSKIFPSQISQLWDLIETWGFREDLPLVFPHDLRWWWWWRWLWHIIFNKIIHIWTGFRPITCSTFGNLSYFLGFVLLFLLFCRNCPVFFGICPTFLKICFFFLKSIKFARTVKCQLQNFFWIALKGKVNQKNMKRNKKIIKVIKVQNL